MAQIVYIIGHKGYDSYNEKQSIYFHAGFSNGAFDTTYDITKAVRFGSRDELFDFLKTYCYLHTSIIFEMSVECLERISKDEKIKKIYNDCEKY